MTTINDISDLARTLREHPEWRETIRALVLGEEVSRLPAQLASFIEATERNFEAVDKRLEAMDQRNRGLGQKAGRLHRSDRAEFRGRRDKRLEAMDQRIAALDKRLDEFIAATQRRLDDRGLHRSDSAEFFRSRTTVWTVFKNATTSWGPG